MRFVCLSPANECFFVARQDASLALRNDALNVKALIEAGIDVRYMQVNNSSWLLHHNKFMIFIKNNGTAKLFNGAGNFTDAAFSSNAENFYFVDFPSAMEMYRTQYQNMWENLATPTEEMPITWDYTVE